MRRWCLVTGGAGFIGSHLVEELVKRGWKVRVLDNLSTGREENLAAVWDRIEFLRGDLRDAAAVEAAVRGVEVVFHQGALPSVQRSIEDPLTTHEVNATGTLRLLWASRAAGVKRVVYASSSSVYGNTPGLPRREEEPLAPRSPYAASKAEGEVYARLFAELYGLETVGLRYFNVYGPRQDESSPYAAVIPRFIGAALAGRPPVIYGDGEQTRDFTYVADVVRANLLAAEAPGISGEVFNIAGGAETSINELFTLVRRAVGRLGVMWTVQPLYEPARLGEVRRSRAEVAKARERLGFRAQVPLEEGLAKTVEWFGRMRKG